MELVEHVKLVLKDLAQVLSNLKSDNSENVIVGFDENDDAGCSFEFQIIRLFSFIG
jgi:hypothetical protein